MIISPLIISLVLALCPGDTKAKLKRNLSQMLKYGWLPAPKKPPWHRPLWEIAGAVACRVLFKIKAVMGSFKGNNVEAKPPLVIPLNNFYAY